jgi:hypothetical protein
MRLAGLVASMTKGKKAVCRNFGAEPRRKETTGKS